MKAKRKKRERDALGSAVGTISSRVNRVLYPHWQTQEEIIKASKVKPRQAMARLYALVSAGKLEKERIIRYRLHPAK